MKLPKTTAGTSEGAGGCEGAAEEALKLTNEYRYLKYLDQILPGTFNHHIEYRYLKYEVLSITTLNDVT